MLVDPDGAAVQMIANSAEGINDPDLLRLNIKNFLVKLEEERRDSSGSLEWRVINHLAAWTLVLIDPHDDRGVIYVELATFRSSPNNRPTFRLTTEADKEWFEWFRGEFETMWKCAREIDLSSDREEYVDGS